MSWKEESTRYYSDVYDGDDILLAMDIIGEAYEDGVINWSVYRQAMDRINTNLEGSWMFEKEKEIQTNEAENEEPDETTYITRNMGEVIVKNNGFKYIYGKYNSEEIQIANLGLISFKFKENFDYIMNVINQYSKIHEISKKSIIENFNNDESIRRFFFPDNLLEGDELFGLLRNKGTTRMFLQLCDSMETEELLKICGIEVFEGFDINKAVDKLKYPRLFFADNSTGRYGDGKFYFELQYRISDEDDFILEVFMDRNLKIYCFDCSRSITVDLKQFEGLH